MNKQEQIIIETLAQDIKDGKIDINDISPIWRDRVIAYLDDTDTD